MAKQDYEVRWMDRAGNHKVTRCALKEQERTLSYIESIGGRITGTTYGVKGSSHEQLGGKR